MDSGPGSLTMSPALTVLFITTLLVFAPPQGYYVNGQPQVRESEAVWPAQSSLRTGSEQDDSTGIQAYNCRLAAYCIFGHPIGENGNKTYLNEKLSAESDKLMACIDQLNARITGMEAKIHQLESRKATLESSKAKWKNKWKETARIVEKWGWGANSWNTNSWGSGGWNSWGSSWG